MIRLLRFRDLQERGIVKSWPQLKRLTEKYGFPKGRKPRLMPGSSPVLPRGQPRAARPRLAGGARGKPPQTPTQPLPLSKTPALQRALAHFIAPKNAEQIREQGCI